MRLNYENSLSGDEIDDCSECENSNILNPFKYPKPFKGTEEENVYEFIKKLEAAYYYKCVPLTKLTFWDFGQ